MRTFTVLLLSCIGLLAQPPEMFLLSRPTASASTPPSSLVTNLVAYWRLDETSGTRDDSVSTNDLTDNNTVGYQIGLITNSAYFISNNLEYLSIPDNAALSTETKSFTFVGWFNFFIAGALQNLAGKYSGTGNREWYIQRSGAGTYYGYYSTNGVSTISDSMSTVLATTNTWYLLSFVFDASTMKMVLGYNTTFKTNTVPVLNTVGGTSAFEIGRVSGLGAVYYDGLVDECGFWDRALTVQEITTLYNSGSGKTYPFQ